MKTLLAICIAAMGLSAASIEPLKFTLAIPVVAGGVDLAPGACTIQPLSNGSDNTVLSIACDNGARVNVLVNRLSTPHDNRSSVVLKFENGRYTLDQVWLNELEGFQVLHTAE